MLRTPLMNEFAALRETMDQLFRENPFGETFGTLWSRAETGGGAVARPMALDVYATDDDFVIMAAVPGMRPEDLDLSVQKNTVTLSGTIRSATDPEEGKGATWYVRELGGGTFRRSITLPFEIDADQARATFEHGILRVVLPKSEASRARRIAIQSGQQQAITAGRAAD